MNDYPRLCITSTCGGGGKTLLTLGLARALANAGVTVKPFKKGPDYIDAAWLSAAARMGATNLDPFFMDPRAIPGLFATAMHAAGNQPLALIEGNRGIFDGLDDSGSCSTAVVARILDCPLLLCIDVSKTTRTVAALLRGILEFEPDLTFCGVVLNRIGSARHEMSVRRAIAMHTDLPVLGILPRMRENPLPERHMGLASHGPGLGEGIEEILERIAAHIKENVNLAEIRDIAGAASQLDIQAPRHEPNATVGAKPLIGYVLDKALWFYYPENIKALHTAGADTACLSLLDATQENAELWKHLHGLYLGGGFPEDFAHELAASPFLAKVADFAQKGMPIYAECGGLMLLARQLEKNGVCHRMANIFPAEIKFTKVPQGLGYVEARVVAPNPFFPQNSSLRGHEFHYSLCSSLDEESQFALKLARGTGLGLENRRVDGLIWRNVWGSYMHIFAPAVPCWAPNFVKAARKYMEATNDLPTVIHV